MKKIAISLLIVLFAIFAFFYARIQKLETVITTVLAQHETTFQEFNVGIFPKPYISFDKVQHNQISIEKITGKFSLPSLVLGNAQLQELVAQNIKLNTHIFISKGEEKNHGRLKASIISDALEALIWYVFLDFWYEVAENFVLKYIYPEIKVLSKAPVKSYKTMAQEQVQKLYKVLPTYENIEEKTDEKWNVLLYSAKIMVEDKLLATWTGTNKKKAQEDAAKNYYEATNPDKNI